MSQEIKQLLNSELQRRQLINPLYSLRAFARDLGLGVSCLSEVLSGKRSLSVKNTVKVLKTLKLSATEREKLFEKLKLDPKKQGEPFVNIYEDEFKLISDWFYMAILNLARLSHNSAEPEWIAQRLNIEVAVADDALKRLIRMGYISVEDQSMKRVVKAISTTFDIPSSAIRNHQKQTLLLAAQSLDTVPVELRDICSVIMPANHKNIPKVKSLLQKTRRKVSAMLEDTQATDIYTLSIQLFPLTDVSNRSAQ
jgi:uncharacterized protein (TIGR02147 family)